MGDLRKKIIAEVDAEGHIPAIGQTVYLIYKKSLCIETVHSIGRNTFVVESYKANTRSDFWEWRYKDFGIRWFTDFEAAKDELLSRFTDEYDLVEYTSTWYEVERL